MNSQDKGSSGQQASHKCCATLWCQCFYESNDLKCQVGGKQRAGSALALSCSRRGRRLLQSLRGKCKFMHVKN